MWTLGTIDFLHFELGVDRARILPARVEPSQISFFQSPARAEPAYHRANLSLEETKFLPFFMKNRKNSKIHVHSLQ